jgi:hypothetical protein
MLSVAPHLVAVHAIGDAYRGIPYLPIDNENEYLTRMQEIFDGHWFVGSAFYAEYKALPAVVLPFGEYVYALPSLALHVPLTTIVTAAKWLFPSILFLLVYSLVLRCIAAEERDRKLTAIGTGLFVALCYQLADPSSVLSFFHTGTFPDGISIWTRPVNPIVGALLLFCLLHAVWSLWTSKRIRSAIIIGLLVGAMSFYFFAWATAISILFLVGMIAALSRRWDKVKQCVVALTVGVLASAPFLISAVSASASSISAERNGLEFTHTPLLNKTVLAACFIFIVFTIIAIKRDKDRRVLGQNWWLFCASVLAATVWVYVQQIVTGRTIWPYHFVQFTKPLTAVVLFVSGYYSIRPSWPRVWRWVMIIVVSVSVLNGLAMSGGYPQRLSEFRDEQRYASAFHWLNENAPTDSVVLVYEEGYRLTSLVTAFTHCNTYLTYWLFAGVPQDRILHDFYIRLRLDGVTASTIREYLEAHPDLIRPYFFTNWGQLMGTGVDPWVEAQIDRIVREYPSVLQTDLKTDLRSYRLDYLMTERDITQQQLDDWGVKRLIGTFDGVKLYTF